MAGQVWDTDNLGGFMFSEELSDVLRTALQPLSRFRTFCDVKEAKGYHRGELYSWNVYSDVAVQGTTLTEGTAMPETNYTITQSTLTVTEYGNSVPFTKKLDDLSKHDVVEVIEKVLKNDAKKALDTAAHAQFDATTVTVVPGDPGAAPGTSTTEIVVETGGTTITNNAALTKDHVKKIADEMKERNIVPFDGSDYMCLGRPTTFRQFKDDLESIHQHVESGARLIYEGEIGKYEGIRFCEQTNIASEAWTNGASDAAYFFGADTVAEAIVTPEEIRGKIPTDYGRARGVAWYYLGGFGLVHTTAAQTRILKWDSFA